MVWILFLVFFLLLFIKFPIAFALGISTLIYLLFAGFPLVIIPLKMYAGIDIFVLLSIPGFILAGNLMNSCGMTDRIIKFCNNLVGHIRGGLALGKYRGFHDICRNIRYRNRRHCINRIYHDPCHEERRL
jgi:C4-dicarboxylate transporter, DctM subunit